MVKHARRTCRAANDVIALHAILQRVRLSGGEAAGAAARLLNWADYVSALSDAPVDAHGQVVPASDAAQDRSAAAVADTPEARRQTRPPICCRVQAQRHGSSGLSQVAVTLSTGTSADQAMLRDQTMHGDRCARSRSSAAATAARRLSITRPRGGRPSRPVVCGSCRATAVRVWSARQTFNLSPRALRQAAVRAGRSTRVRRAAPRLLAARDRADRWPRDRADPRS